MNYLWDAVWTKLRTDRRTDGRTRSYIYPSVTRGIIMYSCRFLRSAIRQYETEWGRGTPSSCYWLPSKLSSMFAKIRTHCYSYFCLNHLIHSFEIMFENLNSLFILSLNRKSMSLSWTQFTRGKVQGLNWTKFAQVLKTLGPEPKSWGFLNS